MRLWHAGTEDSGDRTADVEPQFEARGGGLSTLYIHGGGIAPGDYLIAGEAGEAVGVVTHVAARDDGTDAVTARFDRA
jgi:hypothetical protein